MEKTKKALGFFANRFNCSQSVLIAFAGDYGLGEHTALKVACAFGAGMARAQDTCGAVTGAYMVLGLRHGKYLAEDETGKELTYAKARGFTASFVRLHGSTNCRNLIGVDISTPEGLQRAHDSGLFEKRCAIFVRDAVEILEKMD
ncbi:MAG: C_GCAxxG_C_C family protein [Spirochaetes bacterium]|jgi:C_GCAxxG_C_C family probable redox protein|nr:C_GCAxxG_C_C family protein [Spirochaetota bacterium]